MSLMKRIKFKKLHLIVFSQNNIKRLPKGKLNLAMKGFRLFETDFVLENNSLTKRLSIINAKFDVTKNQYLSVNLSIKPSLSDS